MSQTTSHPIAIGTDLTVAYPTTHTCAVLHRTGCSHAQRKARYGPSRHVGAYGTEFKPLADDYFDVAPCARAKKGA